MRIALLKLLFVSVGMALHCGRRLVASLCFGLAVCTVDAAPANVNIDPSFESANLGYFLQVLEDPSGKMNFAAASSQPASRWKNVDADEFRGGYSTSAF